MKLEELGYGLTKVERGDREMWLFSKVDRGEHETTIENIAIKPVHCDCLVNLENKIVGIGVQQQKVVLTPIEIKAIDEAVEEWLKQFGSVN